MKRQYVHLVEEHTQSFAIESAARKLRHEKGSKVNLIPINTTHALMLGVKFYNTSDGFWLSDDIPVEAIDWENIIIIDEP